MTSIPDLAVRRDSRDHAEDPAAVVAAEAGCESSVDDSISLGAFGESRDLVVWSGERSNPPGGEPA